jgi:hypothetical protein
MERHGRVALVSAKTSGLAPMVAARTERPLPASGFSLLRASVQARLVMAAAAAALLWAAVLWALA